MPLLSRWHQSSGPRSVRFVVDAVTPSNEVLDTCDCIAAMQGKLARKIMTSPVVGRQVIAGTTECSNPLVQAMHLAFSHHLPLTLSPDTIWLTIEQGFSHHVNEFPEALRGRLVTHAGQRELVEPSASLSAKELTAAVSGFSRQIREATDPAIHDALICDFTTTAEEVRTASEVVIMDTYSHYFRYTVAMCVCGIPQISLTGSVDDWQRIRERIEIFGSFSMDWWVQRLRPILDQFVLAAAGKPDREFWQGMYKFQTQRRLYDQSMVTGWVVDLFPYLGDKSKRTRNRAFDDGGLRQVAAGAFPQGLSKVSVRLNVVTENGRVLFSKELDLVAGLFGLQQLSSGLEPVISWCLVDPATPEKPPFPDLN